MRKEENVCHQHFLFFWGLVKFFFLGSFKLSIVGESVNLERGQGFTFWSLQLLPGVETEIFVAIIMKDQ